MKSFGKSNKIYTFTMNLKQNKMEKVFISNLIVEVTRRCNIKCVHCLRGDAMKMDLSKNDVDTFLDQVSDISNITFSGGEPSLNVPILNYFLDGLKLRNIPVQSFYVATNCVKIPEDFVIFLLKMYSYCEEKEMCGVNYSNDYYHMMESNPDLELINGLSFFDIKYEKKDGYNYEGGKGLIKQGRSDTGRETYATEITDRNSFDEVECYLNCKGQIINGCNWSFKNQEKHVICSVENLSEFINNLPE